MPEMRRRTRDRKRGNRCNKKDGNKDKSRTLLDGKNGKILMSRGTHRLRKERRRGTES
jgi:hypothetical protein